MIIMLDPSLEIMLSTWDNPISPFDDSFNAWWTMDAIVLGHDTCGLLAREASVNELASDEINDRITLDAMERIVNNAPQIFRIVTRDDYPITHVSATVGGS